MAIVAYLYCIIFALNTITQFTLVFFDWLMDETEILLWILVTFTAFDLVNRSLRQAFYSCLVLSQGISSTAQE